MTPTESIHRGKYKESSSYIRSSKFQLDSPFNALYIAFETSKILDNEDDETLQLHGSPSLHIKLRTPFNLRFFTNRKS